MRLSDRAEDWIKTFLKTFQLFSFQYLKHFSLGYKVTKQGLRTASYEMEIKCK